MSFKNFNDIVIGIDLGTTNSCVGVCKGKGKNKTVHICENFEGQRTTPSIVAVSKNDEVHVGVSAIRQAGTNPQGVLSSTKRLLGKKYDDVSEKIRDTFPFVIIKIDNGDIGALVTTEKGTKSISITEISSLILSHIKSIAEKNLGQKIKHAVVTVPAHFNDIQRNITKLAGEAAGLNIVRIINEPTAAAIAYGVELGKTEDYEDKLIIVYDLGGGTFDVTFLSVSKSGVFEVKATGGDTILGGENYNFAIFEIFEKHVQKKYPKVDLRKDKFAFRRSLDAIEIAKKELTTANSANVILPFLTRNEKDEPVHVDWIIHKADYENSIKWFNEKTLKIVRDVIKSAEVKSSDIQKILIVGGISRTPSIQEILKEALNQPVSTEIHPDEAVAIGAAIHAQTFGSDAKDVKNDILLLDVIPISVGLELKGGIFHKLIKGNTTIPIEAIENFTTSEDNQRSVHIKVYQGESDLVIRNKLIGEFELDGIEPSAAGVPQILVKFNVDANSTLKVTGKFKEREKDHKIENINALSEEEIKEIIKATEKYREEDKKRKSIIEKQNTISSILVILDKSITELESKELSEEHKKSIKATRLRINDHRADVEDKFANIEKLIEVEKSIQLIITDLIKLGEAYKVSPNEPPKNSDSPNEPPKDSDSPNEPPKDSNSSNEPPKDSDSPNEPPKDSDSPNEPPKDSDSPNEPPIKENK